MARVSTGASYEASKQRYVANLDGQKIVLLKSVDKTPENDERAAEMYEHEKAVRHVEVDGDRAEIWRVLNRWIEWLTTRPTNPVAPNTSERHARVVQSFIDMYGNLAAREVRVHHIETWLSRMQQLRQHPVNKKMVRWYDGSIKLALSTMRQAFKWARGRELVTTNPFERSDAEALRTPPVLYAGRRIDIEDKEHDALLRLAVTRSSKDFAIFLILLHGTGARPAELIYAYAEEWDTEKKAFVIRATEPTNKGRFKQMRHKKDRIVYIRDELVPLVELLMEKYKDNERFPANWREIEKARGIGRPLRTTGRLITPLFRKEKGKHSGKPFTLGSVEARFDSSRKKINKDAGQEIIRPGVTPYSYRHSYVTRWLMDCGNVNMLAELLGTSIQMIQKHYSHLFSKHDVLRDHLNQFQGAEHRAANLKP